MFNILLQQRLNPVQSMYLKQKFTLKKNTLSLWSCGALMQYSMIESYNYMYMYVSFETLSNP